MRVYACSVRASVRRACACASCMRVCGLLHSFHQHASHTRSIHQLPTPAACTPYYYFPMIDSWGARTSWVSPDGTPNLEALQELYTATVPVDGPPTGGYGEASRVEMCLGEFVARWRAETPVPSYQYLKDWHFSRDHPHAAKAAYSTPALFGSDWLNEWWDGPRQAAAALASSGDARGDAPPADDFRFVYIGRGGSWTPLHHDVLNSYSWSANVCGTKRWLLVSTEDLASLYCYSICCIPARRSMSLSCTYFSILQSFLPAVISSCSHFYPAAISLSCSHFYPAVPAKRDQRAARANRRTATRRARRGSS